MGREVQCALNFPIYVILYEPRCILFWHF